VLTKKGWQKRMSWSKEVSMRNGVEKVKDDEEEIKLTKNWRITKRQKSWKNQGWQEGKEVVKKHRWAQVR